jgi:hypothetical protein
VSDEAARAGWWIIQGRSNLRGKRIAVKVPDSDIRLLGANSDKVIVIGELDTGDAKGKSVVTLPVGVEEELTNQGCYGR